MANPFQQQSNKLTPADQVVVTFQNLVTGSLQSITNWTSYNITRDFFKEADGFTLVLEDDRAKQLSLELQVGQRLQFFVNNCCILVGYVDIVELSYTRGGKGQNLSIMGRDICGILDDAHVYPNLGGNAYGSHVVTTSTEVVTGQQTASNPYVSTFTNNYSSQQNNSPSQQTQFTQNTTTTQITSVNIINYQFSSSTTLKQALTAILINGLTPITNLIIDDGIGALTFATGFGTGIRVKRKSGRGLAKSFQSNLNKLCKPEKGETYLRYACRLAKKAGCFIKCVPGTDNTLFVGPPIYDRTVAPPFTLNHTYLDSKGNNVHHGKMKVSYKEQPSVIIGECTHGDSTFRKQTFKVVCINELTGYIPGSTTLSIDTAIANVGQAIGILTTGVPGTGKATSKTTTSTSNPGGFAQGGQSGLGSLGGYSSPTSNSGGQFQGGQNAFNSQNQGTFNSVAYINTEDPIITTSTVQIPPSGYYLLPPNVDLYNVLNRTIIGVQTNFSRPLYYVDYNAQTPEELMLGVSELMADFQDKFFSLEYTLDQHTNNNVVWTPNLMVSVTDNAFAPGNSSVSNTYWIQKVNFTKSRSGGTETHLTLNLPYTHTVNFSD